MPVPLEWTALPISVKQALADIDELMFPPSDYLGFVNICRGMGLPELEAERFLLDNDHVDSSKSAAVILDLWGPPLCGKTYFCHALVAQYLCAGSFCVYIDCEGSFSMNRISTLMGTVSRPDNLLVWRVLDWTEFMPTLLSVPATCALLIVDSVSFLLRQFSSSQTFVTSLLGKIHDMQVPLTVIVNQTTTTGTSDTPLPSLGKGYRSALAAVGAISQEIVRATETSSYYYSLSNTV